MKKNPEIFLQHILESINLIEKYTKGMTINDFLSIVDLQDKVIRRLEIIGEAVKNLPDDIKGKYPDIPWKQIAGMRDKLIHQYFGIDIEFTWGVVGKEIPLLKYKVQEIIGELKKKS